MKLNKNLCLGLVITSLVTPLGATSNISTPIPTETSEIQTVIQNNIIKVSSIEQAIEELKNSIKRAENKDFSLEFETEIVFDNEEELNEFVEDLFEKAITPLDDFTKQNILLRSYKNTYNITTYSNGLKKYKLTKIMISNTFKNNNEDIKKIDNLIKEVSPKILKGKKTNYEKVKAIYKYVNDNLEYKKYSSSNDIQNPENVQTLIKERNILEGLNNKGGVCETYAMLLYKLLTYNGFECKIVTGTVHSGNHAWNMVNINGTWYYLDATASDVPTEEFKAIIKQSYPNLTSKQLERNVNLNFKNNFFKYFLVSEKRLQNLGYSWDKSNYPNATKIYPYPDFK